MVASTHEIVLGDRTVTKRFRSWERDEPAREWRALTLLSTHAPGLAPTPLSLQTEGRPVVAMSRLPGVPLGDGPLTDPQLAALAGAIDQLHKAVPADELAALPPRLWSASEAVESLRAATDDTPVEGTAAVRRSFDLAAQWLRSDDATAFAADEPPAVFALADGNLANVLWDGHRCRLVDFEDSGRSDRAFEIADLLEHISGSLSGLLDTDRLLRHLRLDEGTADRLVRARRVMATFWLLMLLPGGRSSARNPPGSLERQAQRLLSLLE